MTVVNKNVFNTLQRDIEQFIAPFDFAQEVFEEPEDFNHLDVDTVLSQVELSLASHRTAPELIASFERHTSHDEVIRLIRAYQGNGEVVAEDQKYVVSLSTPFSPSRSKYAPKKQKAVFEREESSAKRVICAFEGFLNQLYQNSREIVTALRF